MKKGQITLGVAIVTTIGVIGGSFISSWFTAGRRVAEVEKDVAVLEITEDLHYKELIKILKRIEDKL